MYGVLFSIVLLACRTFGVAGEKDTILKTKELLDAIYTSDPDADFCVLLTSQKGHAGCLGPGVVGSVDYPLLNYPTTYKGACAVLASMEQLESVINDVDSGALNVRAVLLDLVVGTKDPVTSPAPKFPHLSFAPYNLGAGGYVWNANGTGLARREMKPVVVLMSPSRLEFAKTNAKLNDKRLRDGLKLVYRVSLDHQMQATKLNTAKECLETDQCLPIAADNVVAAFPSVNAVPGDLPIVLVTAPMDTDSLFHLSSIGAQHQYSALLVMLTAARLLRQQFELRLGTSQDPVLLARIRRRLVFAGLAGEPFGLQGSRRLFHDMHFAGDANANRSTLPAQLHARLVTHMLDLGPLAQPKRATGGAFEFYLHTTGGVTGGDRWASAFNGTQYFGGAAYTLAEVAHGQGVTQSTPGIPPGPGFTAVKYSPDIHVGVFADFKDQLTDASMWSVEDIYMTPDNKIWVEPAALVPAVYNVARALHAMVVSPLDADLFYFDAELAKTTLSELSLSVLTNKPGVLNAFVREYMYPVASRFDRYVNTFAFPPVYEEPNRLSNPAMPDYRQEIARFVWNFLGESVAMPVKNRTAMPACLPPRNSKKENPMPCNGSVAGAHTCLSWLTDDKPGRCLDATVQFRPTLSPAVRCPGCVDPEGPFIHFEVIDDAPTAGGLDFNEDEIWTESYWTNTLAVTLYQQEEDTGGPLAAGLLTTFFWAVMYYFGRTWWGI